MASRSVPDGGATQITTQAAGGHRSLSGHIVQLIRRLARENPLWGAERIRGEMLKLDMGVAKSSIQKYTQDLRRAGSSGQSWGTFLRNHASEILACDFLQTYTGILHYKHLYDYAQIATIDEGEECQNHAWRSSSVAQALICWNTAR